MQKPSLGLRAGIAALALAACVVGMTLNGAASQERYRRGSKGEPLAIGVVGGFIPGALVAGVSRTRNYIVGSDDVEPQVRCWWVREDVWNGYDHIPQRVRVCR